LALAQPLLYCPSGKQRHPLLTRFRLSPAGSTELDIGQRVRLRARFFVEREETVSLGMIVTRLAA